MYIFTQQSTCLSLRPRQSMYVQQKKTKTKTKNKSHISHMM